MKNILVILVAGLFSMTVMLCVLVLQTNSQATRYSALSEQMSLTGLEDYSHKNIKPISFMNDGHKIVLHEM